MIKKIVFEAYRYSEKRHEKQLRKFSGLPYFSHPKYVARIVEELTEDPDMVAAALLHDVVEDTDANIQEIEDKFGKRVSSLVEELTSRKSKETSKKIYLADKMLKMSKDALLIKLVDRYHNVLFLESDNVPRKFIEKYTDETVFILTALMGRKDFTKDHNTVIEAILSILNFLNLRYRRNR